MLPLKDIFSFDPELKKDRIWAEQYITSLRQNMTKLVSDTEAKTNKQYLYGYYDNDFIKKIFKDPENTGLSFVPMAILEKIRNVLISEIQDAGIELTLAAIDTSAINQREKDRKLLANRKDIEGLINTLGKNIIPPYSLKAEKGLFKGNVEQFDQMGLDPNSTEDLDYFFLNFHRLQHEISGELVVNYCSKINDIEEMLALFVDDMMSIKTIAMQTYVDDITGQVKYKYLLPENVRVVKGRKRDYSDASAVAWEQSFTVGEFLGMLGDEFDFEKDIQAMLDAANYTNGTNFSCIHQDNITYHGNYNSGSSSKTACTYNEFLTFGITVGYIEFKTQNANTYKEIESNFHGNTRYFEKPVGSVDAPDAVYKRKNRYRIDTYRSYYLPTGSGTQKLFKYGLLPYQQIEGHDDEYSNFSISIYKDRGQTIVDIARPHIRNIEKAYRKFEWMVNRAKPPGRAINYESTVKIAQALFKEMEPSAAIMKVMEMITTDSNELYTLPEIEGKVMGGGGQVNFDIANGLSKSVIDFKEVIDMEYQRILDAIGFAPIRDVYAPQPREVKALQEKSLESSYKATGYLRRSLLKMLEKNAKTTLLYVQDIVKFRDINPRPYKLLETALGKENISGIEALNGIAFHRYGIFVEAFNTFNDRQEIKALAMLAYENGEITADQLALVKSIKNAKRAAVVFAYEKRRKERRENELKRADMEYAAQIQAQADERRGKMEAMKIEGGIREADTTGQWNYRIEELRQRGLMAQTGMKVDAKPNEIAAKAQGDIDKQENAYNLQQQTPAAVA